MKQNYSTQLLRVVAAQICQTIGWQSVTASSLEILVDILDRYLKEICKTTHDYAELCKYSRTALNSVILITFLEDNRTEPNLDDLGLTFRDLGIDMSEILEYVSYVDPIVPAVDVPKFPIPKESHFNFLKPGSKEVLTRPVHIHEHLPPLNPPEDEPLYTNGEKEIDVVGVPTDDNGLFKRPADGGLENPIKKIKTEEEGRPTREITSVMMTTSGFISPAREGKLPESKPPNLPPEFPKPIAPPMISPPFKPKDSSVSNQGANVDKKLEKKLRKKNHEKEKRKDKLGKDKHSLPSDFSDLFQGQGLPPAPSVMPREANEHMIEAERKKALKKLKMKNKAELGLPRKKKEKLPKLPKQPIFDPGYLDKSRFDPFPVIPPALPSSQIQAHNFLTGAHSIFPNSMLDTFGTPPNPVVDGKLITEPDKNKLNIFKKISKSKEDPVKASPMPPSQMDFLSPPKFDRFDLNQQSTSQQIYSDPMKKAHKLPKETTMTRVDETTLPINFSMSRGSESSFEELAMPKTPTIPRTPDMKLTQGSEKKEKKERKKKERKVDAPDWNQPMQNLFMPDLTGQNNSFLQSLQSAGGFMGNLGNFPSRNPFSLPQQDMFQSNPGLLSRSPFGMGQLGQMNQMIQNPYGFPLPGMDMNMLQQQPHQPKSKPKKVKPPKPVMFNDEFALMQSSKFNNMSAMQPQLQNERYDAHPLMNVEPFPLQHHQQPLSSFDQLMKDPHHQAPSKKVSDDKMETFDLTSSPEPMTPAPAPQELISAPIEVIPTVKVEQQQLPIKEKSKEKKKKKDKDKEERKKVNCAI